MATRSGQQRAYKALCPNCGAPVEFKSAGSGIAVCGFCSTTIAREGESLRNIGKMSELFEDYSPLQLGTQGKFSGLDFSLVGRLQYSYAGGTWNEWYAFFDNGTTGWLSDDNGAYVVSFDVPTPAGVPPRDNLIIGAGLDVNGQLYSVASIEEVQLIAAQGELPKIGKLKEPFFVADLRSAKGDVLTLDYSEAPPKISVGRSASLDGLKLTFLRESSEKTLKGNAFNCPNCGAAVESKLAGTKSLTCNSCSSVLDVSSGVAGDISAHRQSNIVEPEIALGTAGKLKGTDWQVVGFQQRSGSDGEDSFQWQEYLLYNQLAGFNFLVDSSEGYSLVKPVTGAPKFRGGEGNARLEYQGTTYTESYRYTATTSYVAGEFYWRVVAGQETENIDFASGAKLMSREKTPTEVTYSQGEKISAKEVGEAFKLELAEKQDAAPTGGRTVLWFIVVVIIVIVILVMMAKCSDNSSSSSYGSSGYRGGSGGFSGGGGGGHK